MKYVCTLGYDPEKAAKCNPSECPSCGWEAAEAERRGNYRRKHGLTLCADGLRRLIIKEEAAMADRYRVCPHCGAHLDFGEKCDCEAAADSSGNAEPKTKERAKSNDRN